MEKTSRVLAQNKQSAGKGIFNYRGVKGEDYFETTEGKRGAGGV